jgi:hypothetical protein
MLHTLHLPPRPHLLWPMLSMQGQQWEGTSLIVIRLMKLGMNLRCAMQGQTHTLAFCCPVHSQGLHPLTHECQGGREEEAQAARQVLDELC